jgi:hypothetical protein
VHIQVGALAGEGEGFSDRFECSRGVGSPDDDVLIRIGTAKLENLATGFLFDLRGGDGRNMFRVRIAKDGRLEMFMVLDEKLFGGQHSPCVVTVEAFLLSFVQPCEVSLPDGFEFGLEIFGVFEHETNVVFTFHFFEFLFETGIQLIVRGVCEIGRLGSFQLVGLGNVGSGEMGSGEHVSRFDCLL